MSILPDRPAPLRVSLSGAALGWCLLTAVQAQGVQHLARAAAVDEPWASVSLRWLMLASCLLGLTLSLLHLGVHYRHRLFPWTAEEKLSANPDPSPPAATASTARPIAPHTPHARTAAAAAASGSQGGFDLPVLHPIALLREQCTRPRFTLTGTLAGWGFWQMCTAGFLEKIAYAAQLGAAWPHPFLRRTALILWLLTAATLILRLALRRRAGEGVRRHVIGS